MRNVAIAWVLAALAGCAGTSGSGPSIHTDLDQETGATRVTLEGVVIAGPTADVSYELALVGEPGAPTATLRLTSVSSRGWRYRDCHGLSFLADGRPVARGPSEHEGELLRGGGMRERITTHLGLNGVQSLAAAADSTGRICQDPFTFTPEVREQLAAFVAEVERATAAAAAEAAAAEAAAEAASAEAATADGAGADAEPSVTDGRAAPSADRGAADRGL